jgi:hypothetical protein
MDVDWPTRRPAVSVIRLLLFLSTLPFIGVQDYVFVVTYAKHIPWLCTHIQPTLGTANSNTQLFFPPFVSITRVSQSRKIWGCFRRARATDLISIATQPQPEIYSLLLPSSFSLLFCNPRSGITFAITIT